MLFGEPCITGVVWWAVQYITSVVHTVCWYDELCITILYGELCITMCSAIWWAVYNCYVWWTVHNWCCMVSCTWLQYWCLVICAWLMMHDELCMTRVSFWAVHVLCCMKRSCTWLVMTGHALGQHIKDMTLMTRQDGKGNKYTIKMTRKKGQCEYKTASI